MQDGEAREELREAGRNLGGGQDGSGSLRGAALLVLAMDME